VNEQTLFAEALERVDPRERAAFLDQACQGDPALRQRIDRLLALHQQAGAFLEAPAVALAATDTDTAAERPGTVIGSYKLLEEIGAGGMGSVWMAEQTQPVRRRVALKVIKAGMDSAQVIARFEAERQALALMEHPNIARVLDAGTTPSGRPFFVMELVKGPPITSYCDEKRLGLRERLELFAGVCQAVQHAHQKGIIHRDIKPSNVLIAPFDGRPVVKMIDFGVAKAIGQPLTEKTLFTAFGAVVGTPEYMSPEQAELNNQDIDTRSDIYSLGVLLYELLTGTTPLTRQRLKEVALLEVLRVIREEEPPKPSTRLSESKDTLPLISAQRHTEPAKLAKLLRGELDWIVMKALDKERSRRYETAGALAADVQRYLNDEDVLASPPSTTYRLRKFLRRYRGMVRLAALTMLLLLAGIVGTSIGLVRALAAEQLASDRLADVEEANEKTTRALTTATEALKASERARAQTNVAHTRTRATLESLTDDVVERLIGRQARYGHRDRAFLRKIQGLYEEFAQAQGDTEQARRDRGDGHFQVGFIRRRLGEFKEAEEALKKALAIRSKLVADFPREPAHRRSLATTHAHLFLVYEPTGRLKEAHQALNTALTLRQKLVKEFPGEVAYRRDLASNWINVGTFRLRVNGPREAEPAYGEAIALLKNLIREEPKNLEHRYALAVTLGNLGNVLGNLGRPADATKALLEAQPVLEQLIKQDPEELEAVTAYARNLNYLGRLYWFMRRPRDAEPPWREGLAIQRKLTHQYPTIPAYRRELAIALNNLAGLYAGTNRAGAAEPLYREALALQEKLVADFPTSDVLRNEFSGILGGLASLLEEAKRYKEGDALFRQAVAIDEKLLADFPTLASHAHSLGNNLSCWARLKLRAKEFAGALKLLEQAHPHHLRALKASPRNPQVRKSFRNHLWYQCEAHISLGNHAAAAAKAEELASFAFEPVQDACNGAVFATRCIALARADASLAEANREELARTYAEQAVRLLTKLLAHRFDQPERLRKDNFFAPLRERKDFQELLKQLEANSAKPQPQK
jgi:serine/threonine protein kinase